MSKLFQNVDFRSFVSVPHRGALVELVYFNPCQVRVGNGIIDAVERFGSPEIVNHDDRLVLVLPKLPEAQTLFAVEQGSERPLGLATFARLGRERLGVLHVSIAPEFAYGGARSSEQLLLRLLRQVRSCSRRIRGIERVDLYYLAERRKVRRSVGVLAALTTST